MRKENCDKAFLSLFTFKLLKWLHLLIKSPYRFISSAAEYPEVSGKTIKNLTKTWRSAGILKPRYCSCFLW